MRLLLARFATAAVLFFAAAGLRGEDVVPVSTTALAPLRDEVAVAQVFALDGGLVALGERAAWRFDPAGNHWARLDGLARGVAAGVASDGAVAFLLKRDARGATTLVERLTQPTTTAVPAADPLPPLPAALTSAHGTVQGGKLHVAGTTENGRVGLFSLELNAPAPGWKTHSVPAHATGDISAVVVRDAALYLVLRPRDAGAERLWRWTESEGWSVKAAVPGRVVAGSARAIGQAHLLVLVRETGGDAGGATARCRLFSYHTITGAWAALGGPLPGEVAAGAAWKNGVVWARPAADGRGVEFAAAEIGATQRLLRVWDWIVIVVYLAGMAGMGLYFYSREKKQSTAEFFIGGRTIPFWAAGLSLYATGTSSISFIAIPAKSFATDWLYLANNLLGVLGLVFVAIWIVPLIRRLDVMSVYHYLELRFHPSVRLLASAICIVMQLGGRMSVVLFLPSLAISAVTGLDLVWSILAMGVTTILYTVLGGMKAVVWTDVIQVIVMFGGIVFAIGFIILKLDGGFAEFWAISSAEQKMRTFDFSFDLTKATVWGFLFYVVLDTVLTYPKDQVMMQRVLATKSDREAGRSILTMAAIMLPASGTFYLIGTALYAFYKTHPEKLNPLLAVDATFPLFIAAELPAGVTGLIIAGIFAAAMSTLSGIINSVATLVSVDFYERLAKKPDQKKSVLLAEIITVVAGAIGVGTALLLTRTKIDSLFDLSIELAGVLGGGFAGTYALGMFTRRANWQGTLLGVGTAIVVTFTAWSLHLVHPFFYAGIAILTCITVGYGASWFFPAPMRSLRGLTIWDPANLTAAAGAATSQPKFAQAE